VSWNATALAAVKTQATGAITDNNVDHLAKTATVAADMTTEVTDGSIVSRILSKTSDTSTYDCTTDSLEAISDKITALNNVSTAQVNTEVDTALNTAVPASPTAGSVNDILSKVAGGNTFDKATDSLEMISDKIGAFSGDGGANADDSVKALLDIINTAVGTTLDGIVDNILLDTQIRVAASGAKTIGTGATKWLSIDSGTNGAEILSIVMNVVVGDDWTVDLYVPSADAVADTAAADKRATIAYAAADTEGGMLSGFAIPFNCFLDFTNDGVDEDAITQVQIVYRSRGALTLVWEE
ncbi:MAG: hypothetical protein WC554_07175, partial [Clostridia bacterium]